MKSRFASIFLIAMTFAGVFDARARSCVWRVTGPDRGILYLGGSFHALRSTDYPLPAAYNLAFDASSRIVFEDDPKAARAAARELLKQGKYPKGDSLRNHVDPRTYNYLKQFFAIFRTPESKFDSLRPWFLNIVLMAPPPQYSELGVERFIERRAMANSKPITGLESVREHYGVFAGLTDRESEASLLVLFINAGREKPDGQNAIDAWRTGDVEFLVRSMREGYRDFPSMAVRLLDERNRNWVPKIEKYLHSGQTYFVLVGAGHMGGPNGLLALLKARGCKIEQM
ncbi:MAG: TraB/GumN family protein [Chthoniobacterales bacterium]